MAGNSIPTVGLAVEGIDHGGPAVDLDEVAPGHRTGEGDRHPGSVGHARPSSDDVAESGGHLVERRRHVGGGLAGGRPSASRMSCSCR